MGLLQPTQAVDLGGLHVVRLAKLTGISMTSAAAYNVYKNGPNTVMLIAWAMVNFSAFPDGTAPPATWAMSYGTNSSTAPTNMRAAAAIASASTVIPVVATQVLGITTTMPYIMPFTTLYFAVTTTTNGVGTFDMVFYGGILNRNK